MATYLFQSFATSALMMFPCEYSSLSRSTQNLPILKCSGFFGDSVGNSGKSLVNSGAYDKSDWTKIQPNITYYEECGKYDELHSKTSKVQIKFQFTQ